MFGLSRVLFVVLCCEFREAAHNSTWSKCRTLLVHRMLGVIVTVNVFSLFSDSSLLEYFVLGSMFDSSGNYIIGARFG